jgi:hypothetical protein
MTDGQVPPPLGQAHRFLVHIDHVGIHADDPTALFRFFAKDLGLPCHCRGTCQNLMPVESDTGPEPPLRGVRPGSVCLGTALGLNHKLRGPPCPNAAKPTPLKPAPISSAPSPSSATLTPGAAISPSWRGFTGLGVIGFRGFRSFIHERGFTPDAY